MKTDCLQYFIELDPCPLKTYRKHIHWALKMKPPLVKNEMTEKTPACKCTGSTDCNRSTIIIFLYFFRNASCVAVSAVSSGGVFQCTYYSTVTQTTPQATPFSVVYARGEVDMVRYGVLGFSIFYPTPPPPMDDVGNPAGFFLNLPYG